MRSRISQSTAVSTLACVVLLVAVWIAGTAESADVPPPSLGNCIAGLEDEGDFAIKICEAKAARALMTPGGGRCPTTMRLIRGRLICTKTDSASSSAGTRTRFAPFSIGISGPISIGSPETFYAGKRAGNNGRFRIVRRADGKLRIEERVSASRSESKCTVASGLHNCVLSNGFTGWWNNQTKRTLTYTLQLDGLLVTEKTQNRTCALQACSPGGCASSCIRYNLAPAQTTSYLHPWNN